MAVEEVGGTESEPRHHAGTEVVDDDVDFADELFDHRYAFGSRQVHLDGTLVQIELIEDRRELGALVVGDESRARRVQAFGGLDLHDVGAEQSEQKRGVRPRRGPGEVEDPNSFEHPTGPRVLRVAGFGRGANPLEEPSSGEGPTTTGVRESR